MGSLEAHVRGRQTTVHKLVVCADVERFTHPVVRDGFYDTATMLLCFGPVCGILQNAVV